MKTNDDNSGIVLVAVVCFTALAAVLAASLVSDGMTHIKLTRRQVQMEQAFYVAEGGAEQAVSYIRNGGAVPGVVTGYVGTNGFFTVVIVNSFDTGGGAGGGGGTNSMSGGLNINPNNSPGNEFLLVKPDGTTITRDDLQGDTTSYTGAPCVYYTGPAVMIRVKPKGAGNQNSLTVNGTNYTLLNANTYDFVSLDMDVQVYNDSCNHGNGRANGHWWVGNIDGNDVTIGETSAAGAGPVNNQYTIFSTGRFGGARRAVILEGVQQQAWARYALWYDNSGGQIWIVGGEVFNGPVHANTTVYLRGNPIFNALLSSTAPAWGSGSDLSQVQFNQGFLLNAPPETMAAAVFPDLQSAADMVFTGLTHMTMANTNLLVSNARHGWTNQPVAILSNCTVYIKDASSGADSDGRLVVGGVLDGRVTLVTEDSIWITNHITYAVHPTNGSDDAVGLIAQEDVVVRTTAPDNVNIYAHIMACNPNIDFSHGFYVQNYWSRPVSGLLTVYGGIVENSRGAVGTTSGGSPYRGFLKNYIYDQRFSTDPPPNYPTQTNFYMWRNWREKPL